MGYHWIKNTDPVWQFDEFMFRLTVIAVIKIKKIRHAIDENAFVERLFPEEVDALRSRRTRGMALVLYPVVYNSRD
jgi:hypothetical protein